MVLQPQQEVLELPTQAVAVVVEDKIPAALVVLVL
jgi:hypothetical protein